MNGPFVMEEPFVKKNIFTLLCVGSVVACAPQHGQQASYAAEETPCPRYASIRPVKDASASGRTSTKRHRRGHPTADSAHLAPQIMQPAGAWEVL